jgi:hypothetical protein
VKNSYLLWFMIAIFCIASWTAQGQNSGMKKGMWEYKTLYTNTTGFQWDTTFNELGAQGWELVAATNSENTVGAYYTFKRSK